MKKTVLVIGMTGIIGITGILGMTACAKKAPQESAKATALSTEIKVGEEGESAEKEGSEKAADNTAESKNEEKGKESGGKTKKELTVINGTITDAAMNTVSVQGNDGKDYELNKTDKSDISGLSQGIEIGSKVEVTFDQDRNIISMVDPGK